MSNNNILQKIRLFLLKLLGGVDKNTPVEIFGINGLIYSSQPLKANKNTIKIVCLHKPPSKMQGLKIESAYISEQG